VIPLSDPAEQPRRIVLWRHGRTEWNLLGKAQGHADVSLDDVGVAQAERAAPFLASYEPVFVWSSDLARARETAERLVALTGQELVLDKRLREYDVGARQGMTRVDFQVAFPEEFERYYQPGQEELKIPGAETIAEVRARMLEVLQAAVAAVRPGETGVIVGHGASLRTGVLAFFGVPLELSEMLAGMSNCAWTVLEQHHDYGWQVVDYNAQTLPEPVELADDPHST
jgi:glucosyl-3-phosphoglycerate phosphatase